MKYYKVVRKEKRGWYGYAIGKEIRERGVK